MKLFVKTLTNNTFELPYCYPNDTILTLKTKITALQGIPVNQQRLIYDAAQLEDDRKIKD